MTKEGKKCDERLVWQPRKTGNERNGEERRGGDSVSSGCNFK